MSAKSFWKYFRSILAKNWRKSASLKFLCQKSEFSGFVSAWLRYFHWREKGKTSVKSKDKVGDYLSSHSLPSRDIIEPRVNSHCSLDDANMSSAVPGRTSFWFCRFLTDLPTSASWNLAWYHATVISRFWWNFSGKKLLSQKLWGFYDCVVIDDCSIHR